MKISTVDDRTHHEQCWREHHDCAVQRVEALENATCPTDSKRLTAILAHAHEIVCRIPGGIQCVDSREDADRVIAAYAVQRKQMEQTP